MTPRERALEQQLRYAIDALEGKPWTGWTTDDARHVLDGVGQPRPQRADKLAFDEEGGEP